MKTNGQEIVTMHSFCLTYFNTHGYIIPNVKLFYNMHIPSYYYFNFDPMINDDIRKITILCAFYKMTSLFMLFISLITYLILNSFYCLLLLIFIKGKYIGI